MTVTHLEILVEEPSAEAALNAFLSRQLTELSFDIHAHNGKHDLLRKLPQRLIGYSKWLPDSARIIVLVDRDDDDCELLKGTLERAASDARLVTRSSRRKRFQLANRIAIEELEAWFFGDWEAVTTAFPRAPRNIPNKAGFRDSDAIAGGTWEALERILRSAGYMEGGLRKIEAARTIAQFMEPSRNTSHSFRHFWNVLTDSIS
ncbi:MAG TPA: DUF4276 family protein [Thermoanaerobaculia bacterium]|nr:DUF4276 family protein [Thermoanaerobaculia bacterium]